MLSEEDSHSVVRLLKVLADESRIRILGLLTEHESSVDELSAYLGLKPPTVSHHLARLRDVGLVHMRPEGNVHYYRFDASSLQALHQWLEPEHLSAMVSQNGVPWEDKVLRDFVIAGRLKEIPSSRKKRLVILKWLVEQFESGVKYPEATVNEVLKRHHPDFATLRREFIANRLMGRENGVYWRIREESE